MPPDRNGPILLVSQGPGSGRRLPLVGERMLLGRDPATDLPFDDGKLSREHCVFERDGESWRLRDLGSRNGSLLNGTRLADAPATLKPGDRITVGLIELEFMLGHAGMDRIRVMAGPLAGRELPLKGSTCVLGRSREDADVPLDDNAASRQNTELRWQDGVWTIRDLDSRNGTDLDGSRLPPGIAVPLHSGAVLRVGGSQVEFLDRRVEELLGQELLGLRCEERIGAGPASLVYRGRNAQGSQVAIRVLDPNRTDTAAFARAVTNARRQLKILHPHLAAIAQVEAIDKVAMVISEWIPGGSLASRFNAGRRIAPGILIPWLRDCARGLQAAEEAGFAHAGLRPENLLLDHEGGVILTDLLIAASWNAAQPQAGAPPFWLAPEEVDGTAPDARSNQYSLGCIAWQALSGQVPFLDRDRGLAASARQRSSLPPPEAPKGLQSALTRLLAPDRADRYPDWRSAAEDLERLLRDVSAGLAPAAASPNTDPPPRGPTRPKTATQPSSQRIEVEPDPDRLRLPPMAIKGAILFLILLVGVGFLLPALNRNRPDERPAPPRDTRPEVTELRRKEPPAEASHGRTLSPSELAEEAQASYARERLAGTTYADPRPQPGTPITPTTTTTVPAAPTPVNPEPGKDLAPDPQISLLLAAARATSGKSGNAQARVNAWTSADEVGAELTPDDRIAYATALADLGSLDAAARQLEALPPADRAGQKATGLSQRLGLSAPPFVPRIIALGTIGGPGSQYVREVSIIDGQAVGRGTGFTLHTDLVTGKTSIEGGPVDDVSTWSSRFARHPKTRNDLADARNGQTYTLTTLQVHPILQQPSLVSSAGWKLWGWTHDQVERQTASVRLGPLVADSLGCDLWLMPQGKLGVLCWTDGANSTLTRDPRDLAKDNTAVESDDSHLALPGGKASLFLLVDPVDGRPVSGTFLRTEVTNRGVDAWGRVYLPTRLDDAQPLPGSATDAGAGLLVLASDLRRPVLNVRIGGGLGGGREAFGAIALGDRYLVLGGTTASSSLPRLDGSRRDGGDGQDALFCVLQLW